MFEIGGVHWTQGVSLVKHQQFSFFLPNVVAVSELSYFNIIYGHVDFLFPSYNIFVPTQTTYNVKPVDKHNDRISLIPSFKKK